MSTEEYQRKSQTVAALRQGVAVVQMVFFKELRAQVGKRYPDLDPTAQAMLTGAVTNELFGTANMEQRFVQFREDHRSSIEQELSDISNNLAHLNKYLTDALRVQTLCDSHEGIDNTDVLEAADKLGILLKDRDIPLPSVFMTFVRGLGEQYQLITPPMQISPEDDSALIH